MLAAHGRNHSHNQSSRAATFVSGSNRGNNLSPRFTRGAEGQGLAMAFNQSFLKEGEAANTQFVIDEIQR